MPGLAGDIGAFPYDRKDARLIKDLPSKSPEGIKFTEERVDAILGGSAASLLGLREERSSAS